MIKYSANKVGKRFYYRWIFRNISFELQESERLLITGPNGSGKTTLMRVLAGQTTPNEGQVRLITGKKLLGQDHLYRMISWAGPYFELQPELSLEEMAKMHFSFKRNLTAGVKEFIQAIRLEGQEKKQLRFFSSGMLQRLKTGLAICSDSKVLLLDEATSNMDETNAKLIFQLLDEFQGQRPLVWCSNTPAEFSKFDRRLDLGHV